LGDIALEQLKIKSPLPDVIAQCFQCFGIGAGERPLSPQVYLAKGNAGVSVQTSTEHESNREGRDVGTELATQLLKPAVAPAIDRNYKPCRFRDSIVPPFAVS